MNDYIETPDGTRVPLRRNGQAAAGPLTNGVPRIDGWFMPLGVARIDAWHRPEPGEAA